MSPHQEYRLGIEAPHGHLYQLSSMIIFTLAWVLDSLVFSFSVFLRVKSFYLNFNINLLNKSKICCR